MIWSILAMGLCSLANGQNTQAGAWQTTNGTEINPLAPTKQHSVLLFLMTDCPIANLYAPELTRIATTYAAKGITFTTVYVDAALTLEAAKKHSKEYGLNSVALLDPSHSLAKRVGATVSPEAVVLDRKGKIVYSGRIDDRVVNYGKIREKPTRQDLRITLDLLLQGKPLIVARSKAIGCTFRVETKR